MKRILLVDDDAHVLHVMRRALDRNGYEVDAALSGAIAMRLLGETAYHVIVVGADLVDMPGRALCESIQKSHPERCLLLFLVEGSSQAVPIDPSSQMPGVELLDKPVSLRWLVARLNEYFGHYLRAAG